MGRGAWWATVHGLQTVGHNRVTNTHTHPTGMHTTEQEMEAGHRDPVGVGAPYALQLGLGALWVSQQGGGVSDGDMEEVQPWESPTRRHGADVSLVGAQPPSQSPLCLSSCHKESYVFVGSTSRTTLHPRMNIYKIYLHCGLKRNPKGINVLICNVHGFPDSQGWGVGPAHRVTVLPLPRDPGDPHTRRVRLRHLQTYPFGVLVWSCLFCLLGWACLVSGASPGSGRSQGGGASLCEEFRCPEPSGRRGLGGKEAADVEGAQVTEPQTSYRSRGVRALSVAHLLPCPFFFLSFIFGCTLRHVGS